MSASLRPMPKELHEFALNIASSSSISNIGRLTGAGSNTNT